MTNVSAKGNTTVQSSAGTPLRVGASRFVSLAFLWAAIVTVSVDDFRLGTTGIAWSEEAVGAPFMWEIFLLLFVASAGWRLCSEGVPHVPPPLAWLALGATLIALPIFGNLALASDDLATQFFGGGQARLLLWQLALVWALTLCPLTYKQVQYVAYAIIAAAVANAIISCLWSLELIPTPHYWKASRDEQVRASGLFQFPARAGALLAMGTTLCVFSSLPRFYRFMISGVLLWALVLSDSRTGFVTFAVSAATFGLLQLRLLFTDRAIASLAPIPVLLMMLVIGWDTLFDRDMDRVLSYIEASRLFLAHPLGIPLGSWESHTSMVPPHSSVLFYAVYGGVMSVFGLACLGAAGTVLVLSCDARCDLRLSLLVVPAVVGVAAGSLFEQVALQVSTMLPAICLAFGYAGLVTQWKPSGCESREQGSSYP